MSGLLVSGVGVIFRDLETALMVVVESECIISNQQAHREFRLGGI